MRNPVLIDEEATHQLKEVAEKFPSSTIIQWLYLKGLQNQESYLYTSQLNRTAIASANRSKLQAWVGQEVKEKVEEKKFNFEVPREQEKIKTEEPVIESSWQGEKGSLNISEPVEEHLKQDKVSPKEEPIKTKTENLPDDIKAILERSKKIRSSYQEQSGQVTEGTPKISDKVIPKDEEPTKPIVEERNFLSEVEKESQVEGCEPLLVEGDIEDKIQVESVKELTEVEEFTFNIEDEPEEQADDELKDEVELAFNESIVLDLTIDDEEEEAEIPASSFAEWLKLKSDKEKEQEEGNVEEAPSAEIEESIPLTIATDEEELTDGQEEETATNVADEKQKAIELVDKFLEKKPKIKPNTSIQFKSPLDVGSQDSPDFITQTLAQIYIDQGHYEKALEAFEILRLKYPEKSGFFADRIREIKSLKK